MASSHPAWSHWSDATVLDDYAMTTMTMGQGNIQKNWDPLLISATVKASNFKFGMQLGFGTSLPKNDV